MIILCTEGDLLASAPDGSDIVTANLTADIILRMAPDTGRAVKAADISFCPESSILSAKRLYRQWKLRDLTSLRSFTKTIGQVF